ncbi:hypothetical protein [Sphingobacterium sp. IITKGP-BTPF85]|uniref:hypothetical protein n=1 Tax=Sphingobacterium sp. IITKGP-BTPF85 TaxID=1338009 RepID=UPI000389FEBF|nr:hypothetical protein [Sphingobacterium sp. IITKGP-BTPF85]KKX46893.1 hypothetical protein L950_0229455 [Sphingobacterium sp. IITKGP-BTPF85]
MEDLIKSLEKSLLNFDKESIEKDLTKREKKEKEYLKYEIYWAKFKKFKADFERLMFTDFNELASRLKTPLLEKNIVLKTETHKKNSPRYFNPDISFYIIISIGDKAIIIDKRWKKSPFLLIKGNHEKGTIELYNCNQDLAFVSNFIRKNIWGTPIEHFKIDEYKFALLKPHIENWLDKTVDRILDSTSYKMNNKIV